MLSSVRMPAYSLSVLCPSENCLMLPIAFTKVHRLAWGAFAPLTCSCWLRHSCLSIPFLCLCEHSAHVLPGASREPHGSPDLLGQVPPFPEGFSKAQGLSDLQRPSSCKWGL